MTKKEEKAALDAAKAHLAAEKKKFVAELADIDAREKKHGAAYGQLSRTHRRRTVVSSLKCIELKAAKLDATKG